MLGKLAFVQVAGCYCTEPIIESQDLRANPFPGVLGAGAMP